MSYIQNNEAAPLKPLKWYKDLATTRGRHEAGGFLVEGERAIRQIFDGNPEAIIEILATAEPRSPLNRYPTRLLTDSQFKSIASSITPQGIIALVKVPAGIYSDTLPQESGNKILLLEDIQDPGNIGTLIRTAAAFDFSGIILTDKCADPLSPKCVQSTAGAVYSLWLRRTKCYLEMARKLKKCGCLLVAADLNGSEDTSSLINNGKILLALGNEASGLSPELLALSDHKIKLPISRKKAESLNVAVCGAICMYLIKSCS